MMKKMRIISGWSAAAGVAAMASGPAAHALEASDFLMFSRGSVSLRPQLELVEQFSDNIFYEKRNGTSDLITVISPGLRFLAGEDLPSANHISVSYKMEQMLYLETTSQNAMQHHITTATHLSRGRFTLDGADRLDFLSSALGGGFSAVTGRKVNRTQWYDLYTLHYKVGERTGVYVDALHNSVNYEGSYANLFDSRTLTGTGGFEYRLGAETHLFGELYYGTTDLETNAPGLGSLPDRTFTGGFVGARGNFTEKLKGKIKAGYEVSTFSTGTGAAASINNDAGSAPVVEGNVSYLFTEKSTGNLTYSRRQNVSVQYVRTAYTSDTIEVNYRQILGSTGRLRADAGASYMMLSYEPLAGSWTSRDDTNWRINTGVSYFFQTWLATRLQYSFESFKSSLTAASVDYDVNRVTLSLAIGY